MYLNAVFEYNVFKYCPALCVLIIFASLCINEVIIYCLDIFKYIISIQVNYYIVILHELCHE